MSRVQEIQLADGRRFFVEVDDTTEVEVSVPATSHSRLPVEAEGTSAKAKAGEAIELLQTHIGAVVDSVTESLKANMPDELTVEMSVGFKGKTSPVPVVLSGEVNGGIKITAKWKRGD